LELKTVHEKCSGCTTCRLACAIENFREVKPSLAVLRIEGRFPAPGDYRIHVCDQCGDCADVCPVEAIQQSDSGVYLIDEDECTCCMACVAECPYGVIVERDSVLAPIKCTLCGACAAACPREAILLTS
jgi:Fe-S-cluster-containing dehydrogenase component